MTRNRALVGWSAMVIGALTSALPLAVRAQAAVASWTSPPVVSVIGPSDDARRGLVRDAVAYWNQQFESAGSGFRLGPVLDIEADVAEGALHLLSERVLSNIGLGRFARDPFDVPHEIAKHPGDLLVVLGRTAFVSFAGPPFAAGRRMVAIRALNSPPFTLPGVARNLIAHEIGHAIGLGHNADPSMLMCGRPATCRPADFAATPERWFELTEREKAQLRMAYPAR